MIEFIGAATLQENLYLALFLIIRITKIFDDIFVFINKEKNVYRKQLFYFRS